MADIWYSTDDNGAWEHASVPDESRYVLVDILSRQSRPVVRSRKRLPDPQGSANRFLLVRTGMQAAERWFLLPFPRTRLTVNGHCVHGGLLALTDRDILRVETDSGRDAPGVREWVFTTERSACIATFEGYPGIFCPRCKLSLESGQQVVVCPGCGVVHHQDETAELPCWLYAERCAHCPQITRLDGRNHGWTPDEL